ncbi:MAG: hypothetical protein ABIJ73_08565 [Pseudomonadota bacterium]
MLRYFFVLYSALFVAACSPYQGTEWVDLERGWRVHFGSDHARFEDMIHGRRANLRFDHHADTSAVVFIDNAGAFFSKPGVMVVALDTGGDLVAPDAVQFIPIHLRPRTPELDKDFELAVEQKKAIHRIRQRALPERLDDYALFSYREIGLLIASYRDNSHQHGGRTGILGAPTPFSSPGHRNMSDTELAAHFIPGFSGEKNAFRRAELLAEVPRVKKTLAWLREGGHDIRMSFHHPKKNLLPVDPLFRYQGPASLDAYDIERRSFAFWDPRTPCSKPEEMQYPYQTHHVQVGLVKWSNQLPDGCQIAVEDLGLAEQIETIRSDGRLAFDVDVFSRVTGEVMTDEGWGVTPVFEAHAVRVVLRNADQLDEIIGPKEGFIIAAPAPLLMAISRGQD